MAGAGPAGPVLVTGGAGFAGSHLLDLLEHDHVPVVAWKRPGGHLPPVGSHVEWEDVDLLDRATVRAAVARLRPTAVYHCAGAAHVGKSWDYTESTLGVNVMGTHHLLEGLRLAGVRARVMIPSSALVYRLSSHALAEADPIAPDSPYALSKLAQEMLGPRAAADGLDVLIARPFNHIGPRQNPSFAAASFARQIAEIEAGRREPEIVVGNLDAERDLTDVRDMVRAYRLILERGVPGRPYNVCSGKAVTIRDLLNQLVERASVPVRVKVSDAFLRPNDTPVLLGCPDRIASELGWTPQIPFSQTLDDLLGYWRHVGRVD